MLKATSRILFLSIILIGFFFTGCKKGCHVKATDGIEKCKKKETCIEDIEIVSLGYIDEKEFIINNDSSFYNLFGYNTPLSIDFTTRTLLGTTISHGGCGAGIYSYKVTKDNEKKEYTLQIRVKENGECWMLIISKHRVTIPKIEDDYTVSFSEIITTCKRTSS